MDLNQEAMKVKTKSSLSGLVLFSLKDAMFVMFVGVASINLANVVNSVAIGLKGTRSHASYQCQPCVPPTNSNMEAASFKMTSNSRLH